MIRKLTLFIACFLSTFLLKADTSFNFEANDSCSVWLDTLGNNCYQAVPDGTAPFTYLWNDGSIQNTACISGQPGTDVCVTITDATGCEANSCFTIPPDCSVFIYVAGNPITGHFLQAATTGTGNLNYQWSNGATTSSITPNSSGTYCCTITDSNGCTAEDCITYEVVNTSCSLMLVDTIVQGETCFEAFATGTAPFTYLWDSGLTTPIVCPGAGVNQVCVTVTDATGCTASECSNVSFNCSVSINVNTMLGAPLPLLEAVTSGTAPYTYQWSTGELTQNISPLNGAGTYCVTITDNNGCTADECVTVTLNTVCAVELNLIQNGFCAEAVPTGIAPFTYIWQDGSTGNNYCLNTTGIDSVCVTMTDANGCIATACGVLGNGMNNCSVNIDFDTTGGSYNLFTYTTGTSPYTYNWSTGEMTSSIMVNSTGIYDVTITDATGCTSYDSYILDCLNALTYIDYDTTAIGNTTFTANVFGGYPAYSYQWSTGATTSSIIANANEYQSVTITDALGCEYIEDTYNCWVYIDSIGGGMISAVSNGIAPLTYLWSTGETTQTITATNNQFYSVTVTDAQGCTADNWIQFNCGGVNVTASGNELLANAWGVAPFTYNWSTGATTASITPTTSQVYAVTVTDANGCDSFDEYNYIFSNDIFGNVVLDSIAPPTGNIVSARVYLIQHDASVGTLTAVDSQDISTTPNSFFNLPFSFTNLPNGEYLLKAALLPNSAFYENFLPTYHESALYWSDGVTISTPLPPTLFPPTITMIVGNNPGGPGFIGGLISEGANLTAGGVVDTRDVGDPVPNVNVLLLTENDEPVTHTLTNADGEFEFPNIAWGTYKVVVEILGKDPGEKMVTIGPDQPNANIDFTVNETFVTNIEDVLNGASVKVFPNPIEDVVNLQLELKENTSLNVSVINLLGKMLISEKENLSQGINTLSINLKDLPTGVYFLNLSDGVEIISKKIIKN